MGKFLGYFLTGLLSAWGWDLIFTALAFAQDEAEVTEEVAEVAEVAQVVDPLVVFAIFAVFYIYVAICTQIIAQKRNVPNAWLAWIPLLSIWVWLRCADRPGWWIILFFIPIINLIIQLITIFDVPHKLGKSSMLGLLIFIPLLGAILYFGLLAFT